MGSIDTHFETPYGTIELHRHGHPKEQLRAWDAADAYLLDEVSTLPELPTNATTLIVNDGFGALSLALHASTPLSMIDSAHHQRALRANGELNPGRASAPRIFTSTNLPDDLPTKLDRVLIKLPKSHAQLSAQLAAIRPMIGVHTHVLAAAMAKRIQSSTVQIFERFIGPSQCSLARKKARLIRVTPGETGTPETHVWKETTILPVDSGLQDPLTLSSLGGTFAHGKLDLGTRLLLQHLPDDLGPNLLDYGCGSGVLGIVAALKTNAKSLICVDDAAAATASTVANLGRCLEQGSAWETTVLHADSLDGVPSQSQDEVLNNPPFHDAAARTPYLALQMFTEAHRVLRDGGRLWVVGNRHLAYHAKLRTIFGNCTQVGSHQKFVVLCATKHPHKNGS